MWSGEASAHAHAPGSTCWEPTWIRLLSLLPLRGLLVSAELPNQAANNLLSVLNFNPSARWGFRFVWVIHLHESHAASSIQPSKFLRLVDGTWKDPG